MQRPYLQDYAEEYAADPHAALDHYRADLAAWQREQGVPPRARPTYVPAAVVLCAIVVAWLMLRALGGCASPDPRLSPCAADCHDASPEGSRALLDCVAACSSLDADPTTGDR